MRHRHHVSPAESARARTLATRARPTHAWGIDVGGTKTLVGVIDRRGAVIAVSRFATPHGAAAAVERITRARDEILRRLPPGTRVGPIGAGVPGPLDPRAGVMHQPPNMPGWARVAIRDRLANALGASVIVDNDANAAAYGEWRVGAGRGARDLIYLTISTGIGGGLILDGRMHRGAAGTAGEIGHVVIDPDGPMCPCGRAGHLEGIAAGPAIARAAAAAIAAGHPSSLRGVARLDAAAVARAADAGDALARAVLAHAGRHVGLAVGGLMNLLSPDVVVIGGGVARAGRAFWDPLREAAAQTAFALPYGRARVVRAALGSRAGLVGAGLLALDGVALPTASRPKRRSPAAGTVSD